MMTRETSLLLAAAQLLGPSVGGTDDSFQRVAQEAVRRARLLESEIILQIADQLTFEARVERFRSGGVL